MAVAVSEETGRISLAVDGQIETVRRSRARCAAASTSWSARRRPARRVARGVRRLPRARRTAPDRCARLTAHWELKLLAVVVAVALWFFVVTREQGQSRSPRRSSTWARRPDLVAGRRPRETRRRRSSTAARWALRAARGPRPSGCAWTSTGSAEGEHSSQSTPTDVQAPPGVTVPRVYAGAAALTLAPPATGAVRVVPQVRGTPAAGLRVARVAVDPPTVRSRVPATIETRGRSRPPRRRLREPPERHPERRAHASRLRRRDSRAHGPGDGRDTGRRQTTGARRRAGGGR